MKIMLVEAEINAALFEYVSRQVKIQDGMEVKVEISATRKEDGFTANVSIVPKGGYPAALVKSSEPEEEPVKEESKPVEQTPQPSLPTATVAAPAVATQPPARTLFTHLQKPTNP